MPEVRFEDLVFTVIGNQGTNNHKDFIKLNDSFVQVCDPQSIVVVSVVPSAPINIGAYIEGEFLFIEAESEKLIENEIKLTIRLSGIRLGFSGRRFVEYTYKEMIKNNQFWNSWE
jgi:hypothetical protein